MYLGINVSAVTTVGKEVVLIVWKPVYSLSPDYECERLWVLYIGCINIYIYVYINITIFLMTFKI